MSQKKPKKTYIPNAEKHSIKTVDCFIYFISDHLKTTYVDSDIWRS